MRLKIILTTDGNYVGEILEVGSLSDLEGLLTYKDTSFRVVEKNVNGNLIILSCPNYIVKLKILDM